MKLLFNNIGLKLLSVVLAVMLWAYVTKYVDYQDTQALSLPIRVRNLAGTLVITDRVPDFLELRVRGSYRKIRQMDNLRLAATIDCSEVSEPGVEDIRVQVPDIGDVKVIYQDIEYVRLRFDYKKAITMPISVMRRGNLDTASYDVGNETLSSDTVEISGPESVVAQIASARIEPWIDKAIVNVDRTCEIRLYDSEGEEIESPSLQLNPGRVEYALEIIPIGTMKSLTVTPIYRGQPPQGYTLYRSTPRPRYITIDAGLVPAEVFTVPTEPIDLSDARQTFTASAALDYPFTVPTDSGLPSDAEVIVEVVSIDEVGQGGLRVTIDLDGVSGEYEYTVDPPALLIQSDRLLESDAELTEQIFASVAVAGLEPGEYRLVPQMRLPLSFERVTIIPSTVKVTIFQSGE